ASPFPAPRARFRRRTQRDVRDGAEEPVAAASRRVVDDTQAPARDAMVRRGTEAARAPLAAPARPGSGADRPGAGRGDPAGLPTERRTRCLTRQPGREPRPGCYVRPSFLAR